MGLYQTRRGLSQKAGASAMKEIQIFRNEIKILRHEIQAEAEQIPNPAERNPNSNHRISFDFSNTYAKSHAISLFLRRFRLQMSRQCGRVRFELFVPSVFVSGSSNLLEQVKGWRRY